MNGGTSFGRIFSVLGLVMLALLVLPVLGLALRAPWTSLAHDIVEPSVLRALGLSLAVSSGAAAFACLFGFPLAWILARGRFRGRHLLRAFVLLPMVFPPVVGGVALFTVFGRRGILGPVLEGLGIDLAFTPAGAVLAAAFIASPFFILSAEAGLASADRRLEGAASTLGASEGMIFRKVTLPALWPSLSAGLALTWARALGEFGATIMFAGNLPGRTQTVPLAVYEMFQEGDDGGAILLSLVLLIVSLAVLLGFRRRAFGR